MKIRDDLLLQHRLGANDLHISFNLNHSVVHPDGSSKAEFSRTNHRAKVSIS